jgi:SAM-dependent methyltransferase
MAAVSSIRTIRSRTRGEGGTGLDAGDDRRIELDQDASSRERIDREEAGEGSPEQGRSEEEDQFRLQPALMEHALELTRQAEATHFWFQGFRSFVAPVLHDVAAGRGSLRLIDCGCGTGNNLALLRPYGTVFGFDLTPRRRETGGADRPPHRPRGRHPHSDRVEQHRRRDLVRRPPVGASRRRRRPPRWRASSSRVAP